MTINKYRVIITYYKGPSFEGIRNAKTDGEAKKLVLDTASKAGWNHQVKEMIAIKQP